MLKILFQKNLAVLDLNMNPEIALFIEFILIFMFHVSHCYIKSSLNMSTRECNKISYRQDSQKVLDLKSVSLFR